MIGRRIMFTTDSPVYREKYCSTILDIKYNVMTISIPYHKGIIVLPGVGTRLDVSFNDSDKSFRSEILERDLIKKHLKIATPDSICRIGAGESSRPAKVISITSGKGGVGKTSIAINLGLALISLGKRVLIFDADLGMANIDVLLNLKPEYDILDVISGDMPVKDVIVTGPGGLKLIPGASGLQQLAYLSDSQFNRIISDFNEIEKYFDYMLIDTGAGLSRNVTDFLLSSDEIFLVTTPEPHAIMDAYSIVKVITDLNPRNNIGLIVNRCETREEAFQICKKVQNTSSRFLNTDISYLGYILEDRNMLTSIKKQIPLLLMSPKFQASRCITDIAISYTEGRQVPAAKQGISGFLNRLKGLLHA